MTARVIIFFNSEDIFTYGNAANSQVLIDSTQEYIGGVDLTSAAFASVLPWFPYVLTIAIVLFALSTMISWSYYGIQSWMYLFGKTRAADLSYKIIYLIFVVIGSSATLDAVIKFSDAMILALVFPNMIGLLFLYPKVQEEVKKYVHAINRSKES